MTEQKVKNLQEKFIMGFPKGQHSLHLNEKNHKLMKSGVNEYLRLIHEWWFDGKLKQAFFFEIFMAVS